MNASATRFHSALRREDLASRYASGMEKKRKCKCAKLNLPNAGKVVIRCEKHRGKPSKSGRMVCYLDESGIVRREDQLPL